MFTTGITWHSGASVIYYAWGTPLHETPTDESPDDSAFSTVGEHLSTFAGSYHGKYIHGPANRALYGASGAWSDYAYAASWDPAGMNPIFPTNGSRIIAFGVEISAQKKPPISDLGTTIDLYCPPANVDGYIPKNIRLGFALAELAEPFVKIENKSQIPTKVYPGENITISWRVKGAAGVDQSNLQFGQMQNPVQEYSNNTSNLSAAIDVNGRIFTEDITMPSQLGKYYFVARARVDQNYRNQKQPEPSVPPQSIYANYRTNSSWKISSGEKTIEGKLDFFSEVIAVVVEDKPKPEVKVIDYEDIGAVDENISIQWIVLNSTIIKGQNIHLLKNPDDFSSSKYNVSQGFTELENSNGSEFKVNFTLPTTGGRFYIGIEVILNETVKIYSDSYFIFIIPNLEIILVPDSVFESEKINITWRLGATNVEFKMTAQILAPGNNDILDIINTSNTIIGTQNIYNVTINAPDASGEYFVYIKTTYDDPDYGDYGIMVEMKNINVKKIIRPPEEEPDEPEEPEASFLSQYQLQIGIIVIIAIILVIVIVILRIKPKGPQKENDETRNKDTKQVTNESQNIND
jgi:hypothetical protein